MYTMTKNVQKAKMYKMKLYQYLFNTILIPIHSSGLKTALLSQEITRTLLPFFSMLQLYITYKFPTADKFVSGLLGFISAI